jgi:hypothetical protein
MSTTCKCHDLQLPWFFPKRAGQRRPLFGGKKRDVRRPLRGHLSTASAGSAVGPLIKKLGFMNKLHH